MRLNYTLPNIENLTITEETLTVELSDGRTLSVPLAWFPRLLHASPKERLQLAAASAKDMGFIGKI